MDAFDPKAAVGDDEQAMGGTEPSDAVGRIMLETLRIFGLTFLGPRSCWTAKTRERSNKISDLPFLFTVFIHISLKATS